MTIQGEALEIVDRCISSDCSVANEVDTRISKARVAFANLHHLWRQEGISLSLKGRVYGATVRAALLYGSETWSLRAEDLRRFNRLSGIISSFGLRFEPSKCKVMLQDVQNLCAPLAIQGKAVEIVDRFTSALTAAWRMKSMPESRRLESRSQICAIYGVRKELA